jgi:carbonic anhydrase
MKVVTFFNLIFAMFFAFAHSDLLSEMPKQPSAWHSLKEGNEDFIKNPKFAKQRAKLAAAQNPGTVVLCCSDSRSPPELIFNQGLGKLFVARVAGNVSDNVVIDSMEYAVGHFDVKTILVLGHTKCGAVIGALDHLRRNGGQLDPVVPGHLNAVLIPIEMAILAAGIDIYAHNALELSIRANISYVANQLLLNSTKITQAVASGQVEIIGAEYNIKTGKVNKHFKITSDDIH